MSKVGYAGVVMPASFHKVSIIDRQPDLSYFICIMLDVESHLSRDVLNEEDQQ